MMGVDVLVGGKSFIGVRAVLRVNDEGEDLLRNLEYRAWGAVEGARNHYALTGYTHMGTISTPRIEILRYPNQPKHFIALRVRSSNKVHVEVLAEEGPSNADEATLVAIAQKLMKNKPGFASHYDRKGTPPFEAFKLLTLPYQLAPAKNNGWI